MLLLDLQKAFDTVDHAIRLKKRQGVGVDELSIRSFRSYLRGRIQLTMFYRSKNVCGKRYHLRCVTRF